MLKSAREKTDYCLELVEKYKEKKGYKYWNRIHRELERMMGIVEFHFYNAEYIKKEVLTFTSYEEMVNTLTEKIAAKDDD